MNINYQSEPNIHLVKLSGVLNARQEPSVVELFHSLAGQGIEQIVVDLQDVPLIDSRGLVSLINGYKTFGSRPENFRLVGLSDQPRLVFELTGFERIFEIYDNLPAAMDESTLIVALPQRSIPVFGPQLAATPC
ncbi:MAG: STAS domain-containing protein [Chloroflexota bacterium]